MHTLALGKPSDGPVAADRPTDQKPTFVSIQILRGLAAILVVIFHSFTVLPGDPALQTWLFRTMKPFESGVDIFFIVSGFVMAAVTDGPRPPTPQALLLRRAIRIFPLYWLACLIYLPSAMLITGLGSQTPNMLSLINSVLLIPQEQRLIAQSWTLTHEWEFYGVVALSLAFGLRQRLAGMVAILALLGLVQAATGTQLANGTIVSGHMAEFLAGLLLYQARHRLRTFLPSRHALACIVAGLGFLGLSAAMHWRTENILTRLLICGLPALLITTGTVALEVALHRGQTHAIGRFARLLGDTSYSIYLFHLCVLGGIGTLLSAWNLSAPVVWPVVTAVAVIVAIGFGVAVGVLIELPLLAHTKALFTSERRNPLSTPAE